MLNYRSLLPPLAALVAVVLFARLGLWQLHRADEAKTFQSAIQAHAQAQPVVLNAAILNGDEATLHWRAVEARGVWAGQHQVLLDNQVSRGVAGYFVYTPLHLPECGCAVLVNRGWVPAGPQRNVIPDIAAVPTRQSIRAVAAPAPASGFGVTPGPGEALAPGVLRVQRLDAAELSRWLGERVVPFTLLLAPNEPDGFRREWRPPDAHADRHMAYAAQWFLFALIAAGIAIKMNSARR